MPKIASTRVKQVVVIENLGNIIDMAKDHRGNSLPAMLADEKLKLKQKSQDRVSHWGNTILGARKKRLAAHIIKAKNQEVINF